MPVKVSVKTKRFKVRFHQIILGTCFIYQGEVCQKVNEVLESGKNQYPSSGPNSMSLASSGLFDLDYNTEVRSRIENIKSKHREEYVE